MLQEKSLVVFSHEPNISLIEAISPFGVKVLTVAKNQSPIQTVAQAYRSSKSDESLLVTEQLPLLKPNVVLALFEFARNNDAAIPKWSNGKIEPLIAVYRKNAFTRIISSQKKESIGTNLVTEIQRVAEQLFDVKFVSVEEDLMELDPELDSLFQVKDERSLQAARERASIKKTRKTQIKRAAK